MPESLLNGHVDHFINDQGKHEEQPPPSLSNEQSHGFGNGSPPSKRRKLADDSDTDRSRSRQPSPPWRKFQVEGPTTFTQDGKRRSARTNMVPLELQPLSDKRQTRTAYNKAKEDNRNTKPTYQLTSGVNTRDVQAHKTSTMIKLARSGPGRPRKREADVVKQEVEKGSSSSIDKSKSKHISPVPAKQISIATHRHSRTISTASNEVELETDRLRRDIEEKKQMIRQLQARNTESRLDHNTSYPVSGLRKVTFHVSLPKPLIATPANAPLPKRFSSFEEFLEKDETETRAAQDVLGQEQVAVEARARLHVHKAQRSGHNLNEKQLQDPLERQDEPRRQYAHRDHLLSHLSYFRKLVLDEKKKHRRQAAELAHEARRFLDEKRKKTRVKTVEELQKEEAERLRNIYRAVVKDVSKLWEAVAAEVTAKQLQELEEQRHAELTGQLNRVLVRHDEIMNRPRQEATPVDSEHSDTDDGHGSADEDISDSEDSEQMSDTEDSDEADHAGSVENDDDAALTAEELKDKYRYLEDMAVTGSEVDEEESTFGAQQQELQDSNVSETDTELDSEFDTEGSESAVSLKSGDDEDGNTDTDEDEVPYGGLLSLFSRREIDDIKATAAGEAVDQSVDGGDLARESVGSGVFEDGVPEVEDELAVSAINTTASRPELPKGQALEEGLHQVSMKLVEPPEGHKSSPMDPAPSPPITSRLPLEEHIKSPLTPVSQGATQSVVDPLTLPTLQSVELQVSQEISTQPSPPTSVGKTTEPDLVAPMDQVRMEMQQPLTPDEQKSHIKTPVPHLLRGTLREYQHEGLDWLADLYRTGRSGILADEMGLGKTIQSIALLAHLAVEHEVWGPHLIVVPTSVMLNWEMEFKKFLPGFKILTYYGNTEERKLKKRGWMGQDSFNVCITSYNLVVKDAPSFKRRAWQYMILDEAHNIKNFRSERWQTLMTFNTRARLLLTGTPLQNNLTELWSLLFFLHYGQELEGEDDAFAGLKEWTEWFKKPVESIMEQNRKVLDKEDQEQVQKLHKVIRPFLLRRLKADVEKQMPLKYEHVEMCRLSKRQRQLYDGFMSRAQTRETLASGNYLSIINALMQLRKVCNHPDLFETRPINTSFAMPKSVVADFEIKDLLIRRKLANQDAFQEVNLDFLRLAPISCEAISLIDHIETTGKHAYHQLKTLREFQCQRTNSQAVFFGEAPGDVMSSLENIGRKARLDDIDRVMYQQAYRHHGRPIYGKGLIKKLTIDTTYRKLSRYSCVKVISRNWESEKPIATMDLVHSVQTRSTQMESLVQKYGCITPIAAANDLSEITFGNELSTRIREVRDMLPDPFHEARMRLSIAFPDKRLLQYDCGKLQRLDKLLRQLQAGGHRALIFTQMTKVLDILEQFLNIHGHRYLRLDGATKVEQRQILTDRFNSDRRISCFILSSRSGGLGINLTGADTVIFYDMDWNPAMDKQCTDRAHRIGQTRDVHIYRFVSEHTIESNILRKASQKQLLDDLVIQKGDFTTDYLNKLTYKDMLDDGNEDDVAGAAMDRVLGNENINLGQAEDQEDIAAAQVAADEIENADEADFAERPDTTPRTAEGTPGPYGATNAAIAQISDADGVKHIDEYLLKMQEWLVKDVKLQLPKDKKGRKRKDDHRVRRIR